MKEAKTAKFEIRLTPEEKESLVEYAASRGITMSEAIRNLCEKIFSQNGQSQ